MRTLIPLLCLAVCACAHADNPKPVAWETTLGRVVYVAEDGPAAVFEYVVPMGGGRGLMYVDGLAGEFGGPGPLDGYWSEPDAAHDHAGGETRACPFAIVDGSGRTTRNWGHLQILFPQDDFPGDWMMLRGRCLDEPTEVVSAKVEPE